MIKLIFKSNQRRNHDIIYFARRDSDMMKKFYSVIKSDDLDQRKIYYQLRETVKGEHYPEYMKIDSFTYYKGIRMFVFDILGGDLCECGNNDEILTEIIKLLRYLYLRHKYGHNHILARENFVERSLLWYFLAKEDIIEHGGTIGGSFLSPLGKDLLNLLECLIEVEGKDFGGFDINTLNNIRKLKDIEKVTDMNDMKNRKITFIEDGNSNLSEID